MTFEEVKKVTEILLEFLPNTLKLFAWTIVLSIPVGVLVTMLKKCRFKPISWLTNLYILCQPRFKLRFYLPHPEFQIRAFCKILLYGEKRAFQR